MKITHITTLILFSIAGLCFSCNSSKTSPKENHLLYITLQETQSGKYIMKEYSEYNPSGIAKSNKTLNQYKTAFNCSSQKFSTLKLNLENDSNVVDILDPISINNKKQSGKNEKQGKSKSLRDENQ